MILQWFTIFILIAFMAFPQCRTRLYMVPAGVVIVYILFNQYPFLSRRMHQRKLTYEDLEDIRDADPELRRRFQIVFMRVQQIGGAICAGILVLYGFHVFDNDQSVFEIIGILGGLLSLYAKIFGYVGSFSIACLHRMKRTQQYTNTDSERASEDANPDVPEPQQTNHRQDEL